MLLCEIAFFKDGKEGVSILFITKISYLLESLRSL